MSGRWIWLSFPLDVEGPRPPAIPAPSLTPLMTIARDGAAVQTLCLASHTGTHLDAPRHVVEGGLSIGDFRPEEMVFSRPVVVDLPLSEGTVVMPIHLEPFEAVLREADLALFRFGYGRLRREQPARYSDQCPGFGVEAGRWLRERLPALRGLGMDVPSAACIAHLDRTMACHTELLQGAGRRFLLIEDMNLEHDLEGLREVRIWPWLVKGMDSGPCAVVGLIIPPPGQDRS
jgi:arylformamidase